MPKLPQGDRENRDMIKLEEWFDRYATGHIHARKKENILPFIRSFCSNERYFRHLVQMSDCIFSTSEKGYWKIPDKINNLTEIQMAKLSIADKTSRIVAISNSIQRKQDKLTRIGNNEDQQMFC